MPADRGEQVEALFHKALERDPSEQDAFLDQATVSDPDLKEEVKSLLDAYRKAPDFPEKPAWNRFIEPETGGIGETLPVPVTNDIE